MSNSAPTASPPRRFLPILRHQSGSAPSEPLAPSTAATAAGPSTSSPSKLPVCAHCGTVFTKATAKFCSKCGSKKAPGGCATGSSSSARKEKVQPTPPTSLPQPTNGRSATNHTANSAASPPQQLKQRRKHGSGTSNGTLDMSLSGLDGSGNQVPPRRSSASGTIPFSDRSGSAKASAKKPPTQAPHLVAAPSKTSTTTPQSSKAAGLAPLIAADVGETTGQSGPREGSVASAISPNHRDVTALPEDSDTRAVNQTLRPAPSAKVAGASRSHSLGVLPPNGQQHQKLKSDSGTAADKGEESPTTTTTTITSGTMGSFKTIEPSAEEEAQYTAWATLGPEGLTPEMLQTHNAKSELNSWRRGSLIGRGTYGSVYLGLLADGSFYAVKCVELGGKHVADMTFNVKELVSLSREINMMQRLRHRNLCAFKGVLYEADTTSVCMFMEYVGGGSLSSIVKRFKPLPGAVVRRWTRQLLAGLLYLHAQHIIHRDVKGDNVLIDTSAAPDSEAQVKLVDFGAARRLTDAVSQSRTVIGTPYWMAPEVVDVTGEGKGYSYKADVWSVGCTVAEMLTGRPPWPAKATAPAAIMMVAAAEGMPTELPKEEASPGCYAFMLRCFERDPEKRPTVEELLQDPWILGEVE